MAKTPLITAMAVKERLEEHFDRGFDYTYIRKLVGKVKESNLIRNRYRQDRAAPCIHP